jgi:hypothetical protein
MIVGIGLAGVAGVIVWAIFGMYSGLVDWIVLCVCISDSECVCGYVYV